MSLIPNSIIIVMATPAKIAYSFIIDAENQSFDSNPKWIINNTRHTPYAMQAIRKQTRRIKTAFKRISLHKKLLLLMGCFLLNCMKKSLTIFWYTEIRIRKISKVTYIDAVTDEVVINEHKRKCPNSGHYCQRKFSLFINLPPNTVIQRIFRSKNRDQFSI